MKFIKKLFGGAERVTFSPQDFWAWFQSQQSDFHQQLHSENPDLSKAVDILANKLGLAAPGLHPLMGKSENGTSELIFTPDGQLKNFILAEEFVASAPPIPNWKLSALKPRTEDFAMLMNEMEFSEKTLSFTHEYEQGRPNSMKIRVFHRDGTRANLELMEHAVLIFLDNYLGEEFFATRVEHAEASVTQVAGQKSRPIKELRSYLLKSQQAFEVNFVNVSKPRTTDNWAILQGSNEKGEAITAVLNQDLLDWDAKPSCPWLIKATIGPERDARRGLGLVNVVQHLEERMEAVLPTSSGYYLIGHITSEDESHVYMACKEFRRASSIMNSLEKEFGKDFDFEYAIFQDRYWSCLDPFIQNPKNSIH